MPYWNDPIYKEEQLASKTIVVPVKDIRVLSVNFPIPDQSKNYKSMVKYLIIGIQSILKLIYCVQISLLGI